MLCFYFKRITALAALVLFYFQINSAQYDEPQLLSQASYVQSILIDLMSMCSAPCLSNTLSYTQQVYKISKKCLLRASRHLALR